MMHEGLLQDILEHPEDDTPRLVLADWLDEHGQEERADLIRTQISVGEDGAGKPCWPTRISHCRPSWEAPFRSMGITAMIWRRGFIDEITLFCEDWLAHGPELVRCQPIQYVRLLDKEPMQGTLKWWWMGERRDSNQSYRLPWVLFDLLNWRTGNGCASQEEAQADLSRACLTWAKQQQPAQEALT